MSKYSMEIYFKKRYPYPLVFLSLSLIHETFIIETIKAIPKHIMSHHRTGKIEKCLCWNNIFDINQV